MTTENKNPALIICLNYHEAYDLMNHHWNVKEWGTPIEKIKSHMIVKTDKAEYILYYHDEGNRLWSMHLSNWHLSPLAHLRPDLETIIKEAFVRIGF